MTSPVHTTFKLLPPAPRPGVVMDLVYFAPKENKPEYYTVRLYRDNINDLDLFGEDALVIHNWLSDIMKQLRSVYEHVYLEIYETTPRRSP